MAEMIPLKLLLLSLKTGLALAPLYLVGKIIYNRWLHRLRAYPGPFFATVSRIPYIKAYATGTLHVYVRSLHDTYGDVVRIAPDELSYRDEQAWRDIYGRTANFPKDMRFYQTSSKKAPSVVIAPDDVHRRQKKAIMRTFSDTALRDHEKYFRGFVDLLIERLRRKCGDDEEVDITQWYNYVMFDFMAFELFGESLRCLEDSAYHPWVHMAFGSIKAWAILTIPKYFPAVSFLVKPLVAFLYRHTLGNRERKYHAVFAQIPKRTEEERPDFIHYIQASQDPKAMLQPDEMKSNYSFLMMAGSETTATLLSGCTFYLLRNPETYHKLASEIRKSFTSEDEMFSVSLARLPYLQAVLQEALRMYPPLPLGMPRVVPAGGAVVSGNFVPEKTSVAVASWAAYRSPSKFADPHLFLPERWLGETPVGNEDTKGALQPFSLGARGCPGKSLAYIEAGMILARLLWAFDMDLSPECEKWDDQRAFIIWDKGPLWVKIQPRE